jgi:Domain of unknown function (DUF1330)
MRDAEWKLMAKTYWVVCYRSISDDAAREKYTKIAVPAVLAAGGRFLARGIAAKAYVSVSSVIFPNPPQLPASLLALSGF